MCQRQKSEKYYILNIIYSKYYKLKSKNLRIILKNIV
jgi:hypothetical protein